MGSPTKAAIFFDLAVGENTRCASSARVSLPGSRLLSTTTFRESASPQREAVYQGQAPTAAELVKAGSVAGLSSDGPLHTAKNVGKSTGETIRVELKTQL